MISTRARGVCACSAKGARSESFPWASTPGTPWRRIWFGADLSWPLEAGGVPQVFSQHSGGVRCLVNPPGGVLQHAAERAGLTGGGAEETGKMEGRHISPHTLRHSSHSSARRRRRCPRGPGDARPRLGDNHSDLHEGHRRPPPGGLRHQPSARPWLRLMSRQFSGVPKCRHGLAIDTPAADYERLSARLPM